MEMVLKGKDMKKNERERKLCRTRTKRRNWEIEKCNKSCLEK